MTVSSAVYWVMEPLSIFTVRVTVRCINLIFILTAPYDALLSDIIVYVNLRAIEVTSSSVKVKTEKLTRLPVRPKGHEQVV